ncbi:transcriptional regulator [Georgenia sp. TF02-10]|uniref:transcriptional regulator n=1 Tax=Georgenia sp. TF02-10 TaxID=2917725 RepID=UPI001FA76EB9|nr:transcriptional regulator [Georgenia sp. TF02-10]UNX53751.1 transcriptional regulator [Georgenia sp. TF02-10]
MFSPPRFKVLGFLYQVEESDYPSIQQYTDLTVPEISRTVGNLDDAGWVRVRKERNGRYSQTVVQATDEGRKVFRELLDELRRYGAGV